MIKKSHWVYLCGYVLSIVFEFYMINYCIQRTTRNEDIFYGIICKYIAIKLIYFVASNTEVNFLRKQKLKIIGKFLFLTLWSTN